MNLKNWKSYAYIFEIFGCIQFAALIFIAMLFYTGGTPENPSIQGYSFWGNTISDLGRINAHSGKLNTISMIFFTIALCLWSFSLIPFFLALLYLFNEVKSEKIPSIIGSIFGIIASISLIGIVFTPADILLGPHMVFVYIRYSSMIFMGISYSITLYLNKEFPNHYTYLFIIFTIIYFIISMMGLVGLAENRTIMVIGQKIGTIATLTCFIIFGYGTWKLGKS